MNTGNLKIGIMGFNGAGNSGDDAILKNFIKHIRQRAEKALFIVFTDQKKLVPLENVIYAPSMDRNSLRIVDLFVIGGGDLGIGFGWDLLVTAKRFNKKCVMTGVGINDSWTCDSIKEVAKPILKLFDKIYVRDNLSAERLKSFYEIDSEATTDMAIDIPPYDIEFNRGAKHVTICIRETEEESYIQMMTLAVGVIQRILSDGFTVSVLPFCEEDFKKCQYIIQVFPKDVEVINSNVSEQHKYIINHSDYLVSLGRLHSLVYAFQGNIPMIGVMYPKKGVYSKINAWMNHIGVEEFCLDFDVTIDGFYEKWSLMRQKMGHIKKKLIVSYKEQLFLLNKQFDEIVNLAKQI